MGTYTYTAKSKSLATPENAFEKFVHGEIGESTYNAIMNDAKFSVGARVIAMENYEGAPIKGKRGTIVGRDSMRHTAITVEFDEPMGGHRGDGLAKPGHGWNMHTMQVRPLDESEDVQDEG